MVRPVVGKQPIQVTALCHDVTWALQFDSTGHLLGDLVLAERAIGVLVGHHEKADTSDGHRTKNDVHSGDDLYTLAFHRIAE